MTDKIKLLTELLEIRKESDKLGITFIEGGNHEEFLSYKGLYEEALKCLFYLQNRGIKPKDELIFQIDNNKSFIIIFWACILGGIYPVPLTVGMNDDHKKKLFNIWPILNNPYLVISSNNLKRLNIDTNENGFENFISRIIDQDEINSSTEKGEIFAANEDDIAFIQFSSGSTGSPKGVMLTHKNLLTNIRAIGAAANYSIEDSMLSWMPLTHDMGLIGFHLNPLLYGMTHYLIPTNVFVRRPSLWLEKASEYKVTILSSPNFGYKYIMKHFSHVENKAIDLSSIRLIYNGAEPISVSLSRLFLDTFSKYGLKSIAMCPVYGLAEASLAVAISNLEDEVIDYDFCRDHLNIGDKVLITNRDENTLSFVNVGFPINDCLLRITDDEDIVVEDEIIGHIQIKGNNVTSGYYNNDEATQKAITADKWLRTGDLGFIKDEALYVTGRLKDIIFVNGQNFYPHDIERVAENVEGIELNKIVAVGSYNNERQKEEIIAFVFHRGGLKEFIPIIKSLKAKVNSEMGILIDRVIPVKDIPRTTSGKLQRFKLLSDFKNGNFNDREFQLEKIYKEFDLGEFVAPENDKEEKLLSIWKKILNLDAISVTQDFFELGGNSLKAAEMAMILMKELDIDLPITKLYENQTIRKLSNILDDLETKNYINISKVTDCNFYPLTSSQKRLYYAWEMDKTSVAYNTPIALKIKGSVVIEKLENNLKELINRHDSLRIVFETKNNPGFRIENTVDFSINSIQYNETDLNQKLKSRVQAFDLTKGPLFRIELLHNATGESILFMDFHHIISDGLSIHNFINELIKLYNHEPVNFPLVGYGDFSIWENNILEVTPLDKQKDFWLNHLGEDFPILDMPLDYSRPPLFSHVGEKLEFEIDVDSSDELRKLANENQCTSHVLLFTLYNILLSKYTGQLDLVVGIPVSGRNHPDLIDTQGMFVNNLAVRNSFNKNDSFDKLLKNVNETIMKVLLNQDYPFSMLVDQIVSKRDSSRNPVFDTMFVYQNMGFPEATTKDFSLTRHFFDPGFSKFDISMEVFDYEKSFKFSIEYSTQLFKKETILRIKKYFDTLIKAVLNAPKSNFSELSLLDSQEQKEYIETFNQTKESYPQDKKIQELFESQVVLTPNAIAIEYGELKLTYDQLNKKANQLAQFLLDEGMTSKDIIGVLLTRSSEFILTVLAVLKAGGSFLPLDTDLPEERINYILEHSKCNLVITDNFHFDIVSETKFNLNASKSMILNLDVVSYDSKSIDNVQNNNSSNELAYIIYTSGTTGNPKGVMISHSSLVNYVYWAANEYVKDEIESFPLFTSISFDLTITSIFTPLITGSKVIVYTSSQQEILIERVVLENKASVIKLTPSHLKIINQLDLQSLDKSIIKRFIVGGEELEQSLAHDIYKKLGENIEIFNEYGPTEATIGCMIYKFNPNDTSITVPIGVPIDNTKIYLLDEFFKPVPIGINGDLYIAGDGLAKGYLHNEELTDEKFIDNPFVTSTKMYKSGDVAKRLPNNLIEYVNRSDQQVKINGYRIELLEIENSILKLPNVNQAAVVCRVNEKGSKKLEAYYVCEIGLTIESLAIRDFLTGCLPHYMIPTSFTALEKIPLTKNGKVNYKELKPTESIKDKEIVLPKSHIEEIALEVWSDIFNEEYLSVDDNFFELGGDSIKAVQISSRMLEKGISLKAKDILRYHTIESSSAYATFSSSEKKYQQGLVSGEKDLTPIESWFINQRFVNPDYYNQTIALRLNQTISIDLIEEVFNKLIEHHDGLRLNFDREKNVLIFNQNHLEKPFLTNEYVIECIDELEEVGQKIKGSFDLKKDLLIKTAIVRQHEQNDIVLITAHHLVMDGVSWRILLEDFYNIYWALVNNEKFILPQKTISLLEWQKELKAYENVNEIIKTETDYWNEIQSLDFKLPNDLQTDDWRVENVIKLSKSFSKEQTSFLLKEAHGTYKTNVVSLLNTALALTLKEWTGLNEFVVELENHGRHIDYVDASRTIGWFTAIYPVKLKLINDNLSDQIKAIKEQIIKIPNSGLGYGICKYSEQSMQSSVIQLSEIRFNYLGQFNNELNNELFSFCDASHGKETDANNLMTTKLEINLMVIDEKLNMEINYNKTFHREETINWFMKVFFENLITILSHIKNQDTIYFTPSDFESVELDQEELDSLFS
ncbi:amino acid adenylation domain-containing protein [Flavobacterium jejuense]|uniref:Amino acid adenylation domain-containing protein n=1 Tax=Flavobacterium jejuense TaxID=1544455 RepID=A0ABX0IQ38_9FLAO|nr:non-ribosomal peptide synthetase [Flavobacterium jejuense]NHN25925.1 amino acid adenylation domain-containing protein [Flavobacterium jejuense]